MTTKPAPDNNQAFMELALSEARTAFNMGEVPIGAVLIDEDGTVISAAHNLTETRQDATSHAEMLAIRQACGKLGKWRLNGFTLYTTVEPCIMCAGAIVLSRIKRVVFGCRDEKFGGGGSIFNLLQEERLNHQVETCPGLMETESKLLLQEFFRKLRINKSV